MDTAMRLKLTYGFFYRQLARLSPKMI